MTDETMDDEDFGALLEESLGRKRRSVRPGEKVRATVVQVGRERLLLDLGDGQDGLMELAELGPPEDRREVHEGDVLDAWVLRVEDRVAELGLKPARAGSAADLEQARDSGLPVQGTVREVNKGGFVVEVGGVRAFCPLGAMDSRRIEDPSAWIGRSLSFRVTEVRGRDAVLSRRALLEEENARRAAETREKIQVGARLRGTVTHVRDFGAFVDLGGVEALLPAGEMGYGRMKAEDEARPGQELDVEIVRMETGKDGRERITLSRKPFLDDPFAAAAALLEPGMILAGTVTRIQPFGAFVEIAAGVEGLIHVSAFGKRIGHPADVVKTGQPVAVRVDGVDAAARRIGLHLADPAELSLSGLDAGTPSKDLRILRRVEPVSFAQAGEGADEGAAPRASRPQPRVGDIVEVTVDKVERFGVFVSWPGGRGLVPARELDAGRSANRSADLRRQLPVGERFKAAIIEVRGDGKVTLSRTAVERAEERAETDAWMRGTARGTSSPPGRGLGTLGDLLGAKKDR